MTTAQGTADHCQNTSQVSGGENNGTAGLTRQAVIFSRIFLAVFLVVIGTIFTLWLGSGYSFGRWFLLVPIAGTLHLLSRAGEITCAWFYVRPAKP